MRRAFQFQLTLIVLMNVMFVHVTGSVGLNWLLPMYGLTLAAPLMMRLQDNIVYRTAWNVGVVVIFCVLLIDAATTGVTFLLEDGLILATFCQVHLLNAIKRQTGADLLFFNSFLIALVTSLFCQDVVFSAVFALYAVALLTTLHMSTIVGARIRVPTRVLRSISAQGLRRALFVLGVTGLVFAFFPRDFDRQGFVGDEFLQPVNSSAVGFSEEVRLGQSAATPVRRRVVMRIRVIEGDAVAVPELWRGATLGFFDRAGWQGVHLPQDTAIGGSDADWSCRDGVVWQRTASGGQLVKLRVSCSVPVPPRLFVPLGAHRVQLDQPSYVEPLVDGTLRYHSGPPLSYVVDVESGTIGTREVSDLDGYLHLDRRNVPPAARPLLSTATRNLPADPSREEIVEACTEFLSGRFPYLMPGERGAARNLDEFLSGEGGGHCEYFATALAVMLRMKRIPCRVVTGFHVSEWDSDSSEFVVRDSHAHAWVEVWHERRGWVPADATPAAAAEEIGGSWWAVLGAEIDAWWSALVQFDSDSHGAALAWLADLPGRLARAALRTPLAVIAVGLILAMVLLVWRRRSRGHSDTAALHYRAALRRCGVSRALGETPRELLARVAAADVDGPALAALRAATATHERIRYRGHRDD